MEIDHNGQGLVEYGLVILLVAIVVILVLAALGGNLGGMYSDIHNAMPTVGA